MQTTNRQNSVTFTLAAGQENDVLGTCTSGSLSVDNFMALNTGAFLLVTIDTSALGAPLTGTLYLQSVIGGVFTPVKSYAIPAGSVQSIDTSTIGPLVGYAVRFTLDPGAVVGAIVPVSARITA